MCHCLSPSSEILSVAFPGHLGQTGIHPPLSSLQGGEEPWALLALPPTLLPSSASPILEENGKKRVSCNGCQVPAEDTPGMQSGMSLHPY